MFKTSKERTVMNTTLSPKDFKGTTIKTAFEQMRVNAIINAENSVRGISIINFNVSSFLTSRRQSDALFIFAHWAVQPIRKDLERFRMHPQEGQRALEHRAQQLTNHLSQRADITTELAQQMLEHMQNVIHEEIDLLQAAQTA